VWLLIRNNTTETARGVSVAFTVRSSAGELLASGEARDIFPHRIEPGQIGFGQAFLSGVELPSEVGYEYQINTTSISEERDRTVDLMVTEHSLQGGRIVTIVENTDDSPVRLVQVAGLCILDTGGIGWYADTFTDVDTIQPGSTSSATIDMSGADECPYYLVTANGLRE
jgi:hypothetical protein